MPPLHWLPGAVAPFAHTPTRHWSYVITVRAAEVKVMFLASINYFLGVAGLQHPHESQSRAAIGSDMSV